MDELELSAHRDGPISLRVRPSSDSWLPRSTCRGRRNFVAIAAPGSGDGWSQELGVLRAPVDRPHRSNRSAALPSSAFTASRRTDLGARLPRTTCARTDRPATQILRVRPEVLLEKQVLRGVAGVRSSVRSPPHGSEHEARDPTAMLQTFESRRRRACRRRKWPVPQILDLASGVPGSRPRNRGVGGSLLGSMDPFRSGLVGRTAHSRCGSRSAVLRLMPWFAPVSPPGDRVARR